MEPQQQNFLLSLNNPFATQIEIEEEYGVGIVPTTVGSELDTELTQRGHKFHGSYNFSNSTESFDINYYEEKPNILWQPTELEVSLESNLISNGEWELETATHDDLTLEMDDGDLWGETNV